MTDRELLELASKAAGDEVWTDCDGSLYTGEPERPWNPLTDDGDALRLAVNFGIEIHPDREVGEVVTAFCVRNPALVGLNTIEEFNSDEMAPTRRAIVRAAAEIGKQKC